MRPELKQWRDLSKEDKERIKSENNIKIVTYDFIKSIYKEPDISNEIKEY